MIALLSEVQMQRHAPHGRTTQAGDDARLVDQIELAQREDDGAQDQPVGRRRVRHHGATDGRPWSSRPTAGPPPAVRSRWSFGGGTSP